MIYDVANWYSLWSRLISEEGEAKEIEKNENPFCLVLELQCIARDVLFTSQLTTGPLQLVKLVPFPSKIVLELIIRPSFFTTSVPQKFFSGVFHLSS
jgi:hypothetical protein